MIREILTLEDIRLLVDTFYDRIRSDAMLGSIFNTVIGNTWDQHLKKMYRFWQTILLDEHTYSGSPFPVHLKLALNKEHFEQWVAVFTATVDSLFKGEKAMEAKWRGERMAAVFNAKIAHHQTENQNFNQ